MRGKTKLRTPQKVMVRSVFCLKSVLNRWEIPQLAQVFDYDAFCEKRDYFIHFLYVFLLSLFAIDDSERYAVALLFYFEDVHFLGSMSIIIDYNR